MRLLQCPVEEVYKMNNSFLYPVHSYSSYKALFHLLMHMQDTSAITCTGLYILILKRRLNFCQLYKYMHQIHSLQIDFADNLSLHHLSFCIVDIDLLFCVQCYCSVQQQLINWPRECTTAAGFQRTGIAEAKRYFSNVTTICHVHHREWGCFRKL